MKENGCTAVPVMRNEELIGLLSLENIGEWVMIQAALREGSQLLLVVVTPAHLRGDSVQFRFRLPERVQETRR